MTQKKTNIEVTNKTWQQLNARKTRPGTSFDDVIQELLTVADQADVSVTNEFQPAEEIADVERDPDQDVVEFVRENQPVSKQDIIDAFEMEWERKGIKGTSWWDRHARSELKENGGEFTRNKGWLFSDE